MSRTTRTDQFASSGAVRAQGENLPVYVCNECRREVVWVTSKRTGRPYLVSVSRGYHEQRYYVGANVHRCNVEPYRYTLSDLTREQSDRYHAMLRADVIAGREDLAGERYHERCRALAFDEI